MSQNLDYLMNEKVVTRRSFLKLSLGTGLVAVTAVSAAGALTSLSGCKKAIEDLTVTSSVDFGHSHNVIISGADVDKPPSEKTLTSDGPTHTHQITLKKSDYEAIKKGQQISVVSTAIGTPAHTHTFVIQKRGY